MSAEPIMKRPNITMRPCQSSQIKAYGYDPKSKTLAVRFIHGNKLYHYENVPQTVANAFVLADSKGAFIAKVVKTIGFKYELIE